MALQRNPRLTRPSQVYAESEPFEIKALGAAYPVSSATPTIGGSATGSAAGSASATGGAAASSSTSGSNNNGASGLSAPGSLAAAAVAALSLMFA